MFTIQKVIGSTLWLLVACILPLYLAGTAASPANLVARADHLLLAADGLAADPPEIFIPKPPPSERA
jgi:hypothetical protein